MQYKEVKNKLLPKLSLFFQLLFRIFLKIDRKVKTRTFFLL